MVDCTLTANSSPECRCMHRLQTEYVPWPSSCNNSQCKTLSLINLSAHNTPASHIYTTVHSTATHTHTHHTHTHTHRYYCISTCVCVRCTDQTYSHKSSPEQSINSKLKWLGENTPRLYQRSTRVSPICDGTVSMRTSTAWACQNIVNSLGVNWRRTIHGTTS